MREIKLKFVVDGKHVTKPYTVAEILEQGISEEEIMLALEKPCTEASCNNESQNFCDCDGEFGDSKITDKLLYTGRKDRNGVEIYEGELLRIKGKMNDGEYFYDAIYKVNPIRPEGVTLSFVRLFNKEPDSKENSYPVEQKISFKDDSLSEDYVNQKYDNIALKETYGENHMSGLRWKINNYTNDIEIIGNIHNNPELIK